MLLTGSRDKKLVRWELYAKPDETTEEMGKPIHSYHGHSHFIQNVTLTSDSKHALSSSWDKTIRLWDLVHDKAFKPFQGHLRDVLAVAIASDSKRIISAGRDNSLKLWTVSGECKHTVEQAHDKWISCI